jgi:hypothetical protein
MYEDQPSEDLQRRREVVLSPGHDPPRYVDKQIPTLEAVIHADGGPGKVSPGAMGTNPWIVGSMTIGTNHIWNIDLIQLETSTPNIWVKVRHNHSGTAAPSAAAPYNYKGGTLGEWLLASRGGREIVGRPDAPIRSIRGGTVFIYGFGAGSVAGTSSNRVHRAMSIQGADRTGVTVKGHID